MLGGGSGGYSHRGDGVNPNESAARLLKEGLSLSKPLLAVYLAVISQFSSFKLPLMIMVPTPMTQAGIILGHCRSAHHFQRLR
jgi:multidrug efflux pump subunit AcrB